MRIKYPFLVCLSFVVLTGTTTAQNGFDAFWAKFKMAVIKNDKSTVASLTKFPFSLGYDPSAVNEEAFIKTRARFLRQYNSIFKGAVDAVQCFKNGAPEKEGKGYSISCSFKGEPDNSPFFYSFKLTKQGWRFVMFNNINE